MQFSRYMDVHAFTHELESLRAFRGEYVGASLLESLEAAGLLWPRLRLRYPDPIARRFWLVRHEHENLGAGPHYHLRHPIEPDGADWTARRFSDGISNSWRCAFHAARRRSLGA